jgi:hypothetical protein
LRREARFIVYGESFRSLQDAFFGSGKFGSGAVQDPALNKIGAILTRQSFECETVARIFLESRGTASI